MLALMNSPRLAWLRSSAAVLTCALASTAAAQSPSPAELAAKALASAPVQALLNAQAQSAKAVTTWGTVKLVRTI